MKLLYIGGSSCGADILARLLLLGDELCFLDRPSVTFDNWGTIGHPSPMRQFSTEGQPVKITAIEPPGGPARLLYAPYIEADLNNSSFVTTVLDGLRSDPMFGNKCFAPTANYGEGLSGADCAPVLYLMRDLARRRMTWSAKVIRASCIDPSSQKVAGQSLEWFL
jgi:hypothetical protein